VVHVSGNIFVLLDADSRKRIAGDADNVENSHMPVSHASLARDPFLADIARSFPTAVADPVSSAT
jgi:hypothetical protein